MKGLVRGGLSLGDSQKVLMGIGLEDLELAGTVYGGSRNFRAEALAPKKGKREEKTSPVVVEDLGRP